MKRFIARNAALGMLAAGLIAAPVLAFSAEPQSFKGMIISHEGNRVVVRTSAGDKPVVLNDSTKVESVAGAAKLRRETRTQAELIRGLAVEVTATEEGQDLVAGKITFKPGDLKTAQQISAGLHGTEEKLSDVDERLSHVGELVPAGRTKVFFATGSSALSEKGKQDLQDIATKAKAIHGGYRLAIVGRADTTGNPAANQRLSAARAAAVKAYLLHEAGVLPTNIIPTTALGDSPVADDPDVPKTAAEARRVAVTILVSKANAPK